MKKESQCCDLELAKGLKELGIIQDSLFYHFPNPNTKEKKEEYNLSDYCVVGSNYRSNPKTVEDTRDLVLLGIFKNTYSAFTVAELSVMLGDYYPSWSFVLKDEHKWIATAIDKNENPDGKTIKTANSFDRFAETQADALATLLIACIKVGHIKPEDANERLLKA